ncbi:MAG TPA: adenylate/guanylate cyclase domain-containing protein [Flavisolibacter sp.]|nr:adenylate/guanylate cyclase domain-containing protein [Flavisolibacter sp.]
MQILTKFSSLNQLMSQHRQLSAIMFTDVEGYTAIMEESEDQALILKNRHRETLQREHKRFNGRIIQYYGDGSLSIFQSAVEAVECALAMQQVFRAEPKVPVRMGIHIGDIIFDEDQIFGDGVNLASRIESMGVAGSILISDKVNDEINNHPAFKTYSAGVYQFKNVKRKVEVFVLDHEGLVTPGHGTLQGKTAEKKPGADTQSKTQQNGGSSNHRPSPSIAVLPFANLSNDPEQEYFSAGVAEEILNSLAGIKGLKVAANTSASQFNLKDADLKEIGEKLGVSTVLEGSVRKHGNRLRVTVQLVNVEDGFHLWSEKYDRKFEDIFAIQDEIARGVTERLRLTLLDRDRTVATKGRTHNSEAYELYLKGRYHINKRGVSILTGIHCFQLAIDLDPSFALAHTGYADANLMAAFYGLLPASQVAPRARKSAETALRIDPSLSEPYCSLGCYYTCFEWNWKEAERCFLTCIERNPRYTQAHYWYGGLFLTWVKGDFFRAETHGRIALELEPLSSICFGMFGSILHTSGKFTEAYDACKTGLELDRDSFICQLFLGWSALSLHKFEEAVEIFEQLHKATGGYHLSQNALIVTYCIVWKFQKATELRDDLKSRLNKEYVSFAVLGLTAAYIDELDEAFEYFEKALEDRDPMLLSLKHEHWVPENLQEDARFQKLLDRVGFPSAKVAV